MATERQTSFSSGELSPELWGRTDVALFGSGAKKLFNFFVTPHGTLMNRPGTIHVKTLPAGTESQAVVGMGPGKLVPFVFSEEESSILLFSEARVTAFKESSTDPRFRVQELSTISANYRAYTAGSRVSDIRTAQLGNILTLVHPGVQPRELRMSSADVSSLRDIVFNNPSFPLGKVDQFGNSAVPKFIPLSSYPAAGDTSHPPRDWQWSVTYILETTDGRVYETAPTIINTTSTGISMPSEVAVYPDWPQVFSCGQILGTSQLDGISIEGVTENDVTVRGARLYRGRASVYGLVGEFITQGGLTQNQVDAGANPDFFYQPPHLPTPLGVGSLLTGRRPVAVTHYEGRRLFGGEGLTDIAKRAGRVYGSAVEEYARFHEYLPAKDSDAYTFEIASDRQESIRAMAPRRKLLLFTTSGIWEAGGSGQDEILTPNSVAIRKVSERGCSTLEPEAAGDTIFYMQVKGTVPRALVESNGGYHVLDVSLASRHLFEGHTIVDWAWAEDPYQILWMARSDGALLSMTYVPEFNMMAMAKHELADDGKVTSIACKPEGTEDGVYLLVERNGSYTLERMAYRVISDVRHAVFLDRSVTYNGLNTTAVTITVSEVGGGGGAAGAAVTVVFSGSATPTTGDVIQVDVEGKIPLRIQLGAESPTNTFAAVVFDGEVPDAVWDTAVTDWYLCTESVSGLAHLNGLEVTAVADGAVITGRTVQAGSLVLGDYAAIATVGRGYVAEFESLDAAHERSREKIISDVTLELELTRPGGEVGTSLDGTMTRIRDRDTSEGYLVMPMVRVDKKVPVSGQWSKKGSIAFRYSDPMPVTIKGFSREVKLGG